MDLYGLILAGGIGARLWPLTSAVRPKALLSFDKTGVSLLQRTISRLSGIIPHENIYIIAGDQHEGSINPEGISRDNIILEPFGRGTLSCIGYASLFIRRRDPCCIIATMPGEQLIRDQPEFQRILAEAARIASNGDCVVTIGIKPKFPAIRFGYIQIGEKYNTQAFRTKGFTEKPDKKTAESFISSGEYLWNSGIYILTVSYLFEMMKDFANDVYENLLYIDNAIGTSEERDITKRLYHDIRNISIDYAVMEKAENMLAIPADIDWNDMGTWTEVAEIWDTDSNNNSYFGNYFGIDTSGCIVHSSNKLVATIGVKDLIIVESPEGLLVCSKECADDVKVLVQKITSDPK